MFSFDAKNMGFSNEKKHTPMISNLCLTTEGQGTASQKQRSSEMKEVSCKTSATASLFYQ